MAARLRINLSPIGFAFLTALLSFHTLAESPAAKTEGPVMEIESVLETAPQFPIQTYYLSHYPCSPPSTCVDKTYLAENAVNASTRGVEAPSPVQEIQPVDGNYLIGPEDVLDISVWKNQDLSITVVVRPDGMISMPLLGDIPASGNTPAILQNHITERLKQFVQDPKVAVIVREANSQVYFVMGETIRPGKYPLKSDTTVLQALAISGGFTQWADGNSLVILRKTPGKEAHRIVIRYKDIVSGKSPKTNIMLNPGDTVIVP
jgi:polysaccharide export outer membrane protein